MSKKLYRANAQKAVELAENKPANKVQIIRCGTFNHDAYGQFDITKEMLLSFKKNFEAEVRGIDLAIDYKHDSDDVAAGWIKKLMLENDGTELWAEVDWTPRGQKVLSDKEFRYLSADFAFEYEDNESNQNFGPTLFGAGLTNRPVVKRMEPVIELSEGKGTQMTPEQIKAMQDENAQLKAQQAATQKELGEVKAQQAKDKETADAAKADAEKDTAFNKMLSEGKAVEAQREAFKKGDMVKFAELAQPVNSKGSGNGGEGGSKETTDESKNGDVDDQIIVLAQKKLEDKSAPNIKTAISMVLSENKELASKRKRA